MTHHTEPPFDDKLEAYLDGTLDKEEAKQFEARRADDSALRAAFDAQQEIDQALSRTHAVPPGALERVHRLIDRQAAAPQKATPVVPFYRKPWAIAALLVLGFASAWQMVGIIRSGIDGNIYAPRPHTTAVAFYQQAVDAGFKPDWICKDDEEFASTFRKRFRQPLLLAQDTGPVKPVGISYLNWLSPRTTALLASLDSQPMVVLIDRLRNDKPSSLPPESGLNLFRRVVDDLVLYEVTPLSEPHVVDLFYNPDESAAGTP